ncbi:MAG: hypothetical protein WCA85_08560 [Paraburkholderia sp.]|uniref:hypothetical protein n=1 Tax=Paraburkholderia sp. TaxID=1926495 RepID=UPI003C62105D
MSQDRRDRKYFAHDQPDGCGTRFGGFAYDLFAGTPIYKHNGYDVAGLTSRRLLSAGQPNGLLYGPHSPKYGSD